MTEEQAQALAQLQWGPRGYAHTHRRFTGREKPGNDGWVEPEGEIYGYSVGYRRRGKRGGWLSTEKGFGSSFEEALGRAERAMTERQLQAYNRRRMQSDDECPECRYELRTGEAAPTDHSCDERVIQAREDARDER